MKVGYNIIVKKGYLDEFVFASDTLREAGYIADMFLGNMVSPEDVEIRIEPFRIKEPVPVEEEREDE